MSAEIIHLRRSQAAPPLPMDIKFSDDASNQHLQITLADHDSQLAEPSNPNPCTLELACLLACVDGMARYLRQAVPGLSDAGVEHYLTTALAHYSARKLGGRE